MDLWIENDWRGAPAAADDRTRVTLCRSSSSSGAALAVEIEAPFHGNPPPPGPAGATPGLWNFEVVELFLVGAEARYLELEFGPHGHWLALGLHGERNVVHSEPSPGRVRFEAARSAARWRGRALVDSALLPEGLERLNAFAIHGVGPERTYLACSPLPGAAPDFHQIEAFPAFDFEALPVRRQT